MRIRFLAAVCLVLASIVLGQAASPTFWRVSTQTDFLKGEVQNLSIDSDGRVLLGPLTRTVHESTAPFLWTLLAGPNGSLYAGTGNEGKVLAIDGSGKGTVLFDAPELEVHALAPAPDGGLFAGTSPDGKIYRIDARGNATTFFDPDDKYIWSLAVDRSGTLYAATGEKGVIYRITRDGKGEAFYQTRATHAISLLFDRDENLIAGTESPGKVFRIDKAGKGFVLLDSGYREIHALRLDQKGTIYAAAVNPRAGADSPSPPAPAADPGRPLTPSVSTEITSVSVDVSVSAAPEPRRSAREDRRGSRGAVYRIAVDGVWDTVWESRDDAPYDLAFDAGGALLVGTGNSGKIFRVTGNPSTTTLLGRAAGQQVTRFLPAGGGQNYYATSNPGKVFLLSSDAANEGTYTSEVRDAGTVAGWGTISWRATTPPSTSVQIFTRSGNTQTPDETWSPWAGPYKRDEGDQITNPKARYIQWKAVLAGKGAGPVLTSVTTAYLPHNLRPKVTSLTVHPPGIVFQRPFSTGEPEIAGFGDATTDARLPAFSLAQPNQGASTPGGPPLGRRLYQKGLQTFVWRAEDDNDDKLVFELLYRREGETTWKVLKRDITDALYAWDTSSVPNGRYYAKIQASDSPSNPPNLALTGELESTSFEIDNAPPSIVFTGLRRDGSRSVLLFEVRDDQSPVDRVEYSLDADRWRQIYPKDGIADTRVEPFELPLESEAMIRSVVIRATDTMNNTVTARGETK
jgi:WD40 repeat protein